MASIPLSRRRRTLGPRFSEGTRRLWLALEAQGLAHHAAAARIGCKRGVFSRVVYGDVTPGIALLAQIERAFAIAPSLWAKAPEKPFSLPSEAA